MRLVRPRSALRATGERPPSSVTPRLTRGPAAHLCRRSLPLDAGSRSRLSGKTLRSVSRFPEARMGCPGPFQTHTGEIGTAPVCPPGNRGTNARIASSTLPSFPSPIRSGTGSGGNPERYGTAPVCGLWIPVFTGMTIRICRPAPAQIEAHTTVSFLQLPIAQRAPPGVRELASISKIDRFIWLGPKTDSTGQLHGVMQPCAGLADFRQH